jgi:hypothetical protein
VCCGRGRSGSARTGSDCPWVAGASAGNEWQRRPCPLSHQAALKRCVEAVLCPPLRRATRPPARPVCRAPGCH